jgi:hypothetical protein
MALVAEWAPDNTSPDYQSLYPVLAEHGGPLAMNVQYVLAQFQAGTIQLPEQARPRPHPDGAAVAPPRGLAPRGGPRPRYCSAGLPRMEVTGLKARCDADASLTHPSRHRA